MWLKVCGNEANKVSEVNGIYLDVIWADDQHRMGASNLLILGEKAIVNECYN